MRTQGSSLFFVKNLRTFEILKYEDKLAGSYRLLNNGDVLSEKVHKSVDSKSRGQSYVSRNHTRIILGSYVPPPGVVLRGSSIFFFFSFLQSQAPDILTCEK